MQILCVYVNGGFSFAARRAEAAGVSAFDEDLITEGETG